MSIQRIDLFGTLYKMEIVVRTIIIFNTISKCKLKILDNTVLIISNKSWNKTIKMTDFLWLKPISTSLWCMWFLSGSINDFLLYILIINTLITSSNGYDNINTTKRAGLKGKKSNEGWLVFKNDKDNTAINSPNPKEPVSPRNIFLVVEKLKYRKTNNVEMNDKRSNK